MTICEFVEGEKLGRENDAKPNNRHKPECERDNAAVHYMEAFMVAVDREHSDSENGAHRIRANKVYKELTAVPVGKIYRNLFNTSVTLRYLCNNGTLAASSAGAWLTDKDVERMVAMDLGTFKRSVITQLKLKGAYPSSDSNCSRR